MAIPTQGGLGQASAAQQRPPAQSGGKFDASAAQAENIEEITNSKPTSLKDKVVDDLGDQREAMNSALMRMRESLDARKNRMFNPVLMQAAAGFLKPTKTGSFGESLGSAAENVGIASEREMAREAENQKLEMELVSKEQELRQQLMGSRLLEEARGTQPGGQQIAMASTGAAPSAAQQSGQNLQQTISDAKQGRIKITDQFLTRVMESAPKILPIFQEIRKAQEGEEKNRIESEKLGQDKRKVIPRGLRTEREMNVSEYAEYQAALKQYFADGDEQKLLVFYDSKGYLESEQVRNRKVVPTGGTPAPISPARSSSEQKAEEETQTTTAKGRAEAAEKLASRLGLQAEAAFDNSNIAKDMVGYATNNPLVFDIMNRPGLGNAIARAVQEGANVGNFNINLPAATIKQYELSGNDLTALQLFMQKSAQLQSRGRQLNRTPGEGSTSDYETKLLGGIYALPSDSQRAIILKSDALIMQGMFDEQRFKLWNQKSRQSGYTYNDFLVDDDFKSLKADYRKTLDRVREENMDLLSPKKKDKVPATSSTPAPAASAPAKPASSTTAPSSPAASAPATVPQTQAPVNESPLERFKREKAERDKKAQGAT